MFYSLAVLFFCKKKSCVSIVVGKENLEKEKDFCLLVVVSWLVVLSTFVTCLVVGRFVRRFARQGSRRKRNKKRDYLSTCNLFDISLIPLLLRRRCPLLDENVPLVCLLSLSSVFDGLF